MTYSVGENTRWPFTIIIADDNDPIIEVGRHAYSTDDTLSSIAKRPENIRQYAKLVQFVERANRAEAAEARVRELEAANAELKRQLEQAQKELNHYHRLQADIDMGVVVLEYPSEGEDQS